MKINSDRLWSWNHNNMEKSAIWTTEPLSLVIYNKGNIFKDQCQIFTKPFWSHKSRYNLLTKKKKKKDQSKMLKLTLNGGLMSELTEPLWHKGSRCSSEVAQVSDQNFNAWEIQNSVQDKGDHVFTFHQRSSHTITSSSLLRLTVCTKESFSIAMIFSCSLL